MPNSVDLCSSVATDLCSSVAIDPLRLSLWIRLWFRFSKPWPATAAASRRARPFIQAQDDLTGKPGTFQFVSCDACGLTYQNPRVSLDHIKDFYDDEYIAHRKTNWGFSEQGVRPRHEPARCVEGSVWSRAT